MSITTCTKCGHLFKKTTSVLCPTCIHDEDEIFDKVKQYIRQNRAATADEIANSLGISLQVVAKFIKEGRLIEFENTTYPCEHCGRLIITGKYCLDCLKLLSNHVNEIKSAIVQERKDKSGGYYTNRDK
jgi:predicted  nucleic acid-binding Zn-ribbon protein